MRSEDSGSLYQAARSERVGGPGAVGGELERRQPLQLPAASTRPAAPTPRPGSARAAITRSRGSGPAKRGAMAPAHGGARCRLSRARAPITPKDHWSPAMWWRLSRSRCSSAAMRRRRVLSTGPWPRSKRWRAAAVAMRRASSPAEAPRWLKSSSGRLTGAAGCTSCTGTPSSTWKVVRSTSCRSTSSERARSSAARSSVPRRRSAAGML